ncbi:MAG: hypothetical protein L6Q47_06070 [Ignavibacteriaceae bacterium]|nr:hypothetical protein [Ignavibacteriaceae bacterium]
MKGKILKIAIKTIPVCASVKQAKRKIDLLLFDSPVLIFSHSEFPEIISDSNQNVNFLNLPLKEAVCI